MTDVPPPVLIVDVWARYTHAPLTHPAATSATAQHDEANMAADLRIPGVADGVADSATPSATPDVLAAAAAPGF